jgi:hypothetical protein
MQHNRYYLRAYLQPAFLICAAVLAISGGGMSVAISRLGVYLKKSPLPLRKPLDFVDEKTLTPYKVIAKSEIAIEEVVKSLGTEDYLQWQLEDLSVSPDSPVRKCSLFVTYYDLPDHVPHVPEECYMGGGYQRLESESLTLEVSRKDYAALLAEKKGVGSDKHLEAGEIPARYLVFAGSRQGALQSDTRFSVFYVFNVNGAYANSREDTRVILNRNLFGKYSYFSKVEWKFFNIHLGQAVCPSKQEAIAASQRLLGVVLPVLEKEHWPDWQNVNAK